MTNEISPPSQVVRDRITASARLERYCVWSGLLLIPPFFGGQLLARAFPPWAPTTSGSDIARMFSEYHLSAGIGIMLVTAGACLYGTWGAAVTAWVWRIESDRRPPILTIAHGIMVGGNVTYFELIGLSWSTAHYRAGEVSPDITLTVTDFAWFLYLGAWGPFSLQAVILAVALIDDRRNRKLFPSSRTLIFLSLAYAVAGLISAPIGLVKSGFFAWDGAVLWIVLGCFGAWEFTLTAQLLRAIKRDERQKLEQLTDEGASPLGQPAH